MHLDGVRRQLTEALGALDAAVDHARRGEVDPAYRAALRSRNLLFHATRGLAAARGEPLPEMPVTGAPGGALEDAAPARAALEAALAVTDDRTMVDPLQAARVPYARFLGYLRAEVARLLAPKP